MYVNVEVNVDDVIAGMEDDDLVTLVQDRGYTVLNKGYDYPDSDELRRALLADDKQKVYEICAGIYMPVNLLPARK